jgi:carboxyl-terminal processing protease
MKSKLQRWAMAILAAAGWAAPPAEPVDRRADLESFEQVWRTVRDRHYDPRLGGLDWDAVRAEFRLRVEAARNRGEVREALAEMLGRLRESHFQIIPAEYIDASAGARSESRFEGETGLDVRVVGDELVVTGVTPGSAAAEAHVRPGWACVRIQETDVRRLLKEALADLAGNPQRGWMLAGAAKDRLAGKPGEWRAAAFEDGAGRLVEKRFQLRERPGERTSIGHVRNVPVRVEVRGLETDAGYISFSNFIYPQYVMTHFNQAMERFRGARGIVIDLRGNTGGMMDLAMGMSGWFLAERGLSLGRMTMREGSLNVAVRPRAQAFTGRVAILVDGMTASCGEVFAAGLQDLGRARIFGSRTAGAVLASAIERLPNGDALQFVVADYVSHGGRRLEGVGVVLDVEAPWDRASLLAGKDAALERALEWIRGEGGVK